MLWLCLHFPKLPLEALASKPVCNDDILRVVIEGQRAITCDDEVEALGVTPGLKQSTVSGLLSGHPLKLLSREPQEELKMLKRLRQWAYSITPTLTLWRDDCLQLEIGRCLLVHGGLERLIEKITAELDRRGFTTHIGIGPSQESAWLFSQTSLTPEVSQLDDGASLETRLSSIALHRLDGFEKMCLHSTKPAFIASANSCTSPREPKAALQSGVL